MRMVRIDPTLGCLGALLIGGLFLFGMAAVFQFLLTTPFGLTLLGILLIAYFVRNWRRQSLYQNGASRMEGFESRERADTSGSSNPFEAAEKKNGIDRNQAIDVTEYREVGPSQDSDREQ